MRSIDLKYKTLNILLNDVLTKPNYDVQSCIHLELNMADKKTSDMISGLLCSNHVGVGR
jgi:hypothetical protein